MGHLSKKESLQHTRPRWEQREVFAAIIRPTEASYTRGAEGRYITIIIIEGGRVWVLIFKSLKQGGGSGRGKLVVFGNSSKGLELAGLLGRLPEE